MIHDSFRSAQAAYDNMSPWDEDDCEGYYGIEAEIDAINAALEDGDLARIEAAVDMALDLIETRPHMHVSRRTDELEVCDHCEDLLRQLKRAVDAAMRYADTFPPVEVTFPNCQHCGHFHRWLGRQGWRWAVCCDCGQITKTEPARAPVGSWLLEVKK